MREILNKIGKDKVNETAKAFGASKTEITENFGKDFAIPPHLRLLQLYTQDQR